MHRLWRIALVGFIAFAALLAAALPAAAITGGTEDTSNTYSNVGMLVFYQPDGRFRCSGTLIDERVFLTAAHCAFLDIGKVIVTFDPFVAHDQNENELNVPRAADDSGPDDAHSDVGYASSDLTAPKYQGSLTWHLGTAYAHPDYSDFTDLKNWNDAGVVVFDEAVDLPTRPLAPGKYLDAYKEPKLNNTDFLVIGYGTEVRQAESGPQKPTPMRFPIVRRFTTEVGQKLTDQVLQTNGNDKDPRAGGGSCFGDSGGPISLNGYVVGVASYAFTNNCRYLGGWQRVDNPGVLSWIESCIAELTCESKEAA
jgi:secreted trypsin-like serine protease